MRYRGVALAWIQAYRCEGGVLECRSFWRYGDSCFSSSWCCGELPTPLDPVTRVRAISPVLPHHTGTKLHIPTHGSLDWAVQLPSIMNAFDVQDAVRRVNTVCLPRTSGRPVLLSQISTVHTRPCFFPPSDSRTRAVRGVRAPWTCRTHLKARRYVKLSTTTHPCVHGELGSEIRVSFHFLTDMTYARSQLLGLHVADSTLRRNTSRSWWMMEASQQCVFLVPLSVVVKINFVTGWYVLENAT